MKDLRAYRNKALPLLDYFIKKYENLRNLSFYVLLVNV